MTEIDLPLGVFIEHSSTTSPHQNYIGHALNKSESSGFDLPLQSVPRARKRTVSVNKTVLQLKNQGVEDTLDY